MNGRSEHQIDRDFNQVVVPHSGQFSLQVSGRGCATNGQFISAVGWDIASGLDPTGVSDVIKAVGLD